MDGFFSKVFLLAVIVAGFAFTGDLNWVADRGLRVLSATDVTPPSAARGPLPAVEPPPPTAVTSPAAAAAPRPQPGQAAAARPAAGIRPPAVGPDAVAWSTLESGDRVLVWLGGRVARCLAIDVVDPAAGEALAYEVAGPVDAGRPLIAAAPPARVIVGRPAAGRPPAALAKGGMLHVAPAGIAAVGDAGRWLGPIEGLAVDHERRP
ncbi:MAG: hypothetical protein FJ284_13355 [Planctomycetes bacterium]|nr:hypothetical protein [Planctomycetota bacterium]